METLKEIIGHTHDGKEISFQTFSLRPEIIRSCKTLTPLGTVCLRVASIYDPTIDFPEAVLQEIDARGRRGGSPDLP